METIKGKFYTKFEDETLEEAINNHTSGYDSIAEAIADTSTFEKQESYIIVDSEINIVYKQK